ncbi:MAG: DNA/RNA nuclease SfsA, partial [Alphaproteobacteria bacterium]
TSRGAKHLRELANQVEAGNRAVMLFVIQRDDCDSFKLAREIDPTYGLAFDDARSRGVEMLAYACTVTPEEVTITIPVPIAE